MFKLTTSSYREHATFINSIAFLPSVISAAFFLLALGMIYFETMPLSTVLEKRLPFELVRDEENARLILNTLAGGIISLTVFSFSMVMIVLSQASNNLSPRVIPGLTTARSHQLVLGFYIGTIIYILLLLLSYKPQNNGMQTPAIAILLALAFGIICLVLFVYFIHSISKAIQVDNILNSVFNEAAEALDREERVVGMTHVPVNPHSNSFSYYLKNNTNGYLKEVVLADLQCLAEEYKLQIEILVEVGTFTVDGMPLLKMTKDPRSEEKLEKKLQECFIMSKDEVVMKDFEEGVKQISEVAVKALSPGINDPGSALKSIDFLTLLFIRRMKFDERNCLQSHEKHALVIDKIITLDELMHRYLSPIRTYGKQDLQINLRLLKCFLGLLHQNPATEKVNVIRKHAYAVISDADESIHNVVDRERLNVLVSEINELLPGEQKFELLKVE